MSYYLSCPLDLMYHIVKSHHDLHFISALDLVLKPYRVVKAKYV